MAVKKSSSIYNLIQSHINTTNICVWLTCSMRSIRIWEWSSERPTTLIYECTLVSRGIFILSYEIYLFLLFFRQWTMNDERVIPTVQRIVRSMCARCAREIYEPNGSIHSFRENSFGQTASRIEVEQFLFAIFYEYIIIIIYLFATI